MKLVSTVLLMTHWSFLLLGKWSFSQAEPVDWTYHLQAGLRIPKYLSYFFANVSDPCTCKARCFIDRRCKAWSAVSVNESLECRLAQTLPDDASLICDDTALFGYRLEAASNALFNSQDSGSSATSQPSTSQIGLTLSPTSPASSPTAGGPQSGSSTSPTATLATSPTLSVPTPTSTLLAANAASTQTITPPPSATTIATTPAPATTPVTTPATNPSASSPSSPPSAAATTIPTLTTTTTARTNVATTIRAGLPTTPGLNPPNPTTIPKYGSGFTTDSLNMVNVVDSNLHQTQYSGPSSTERD